MALFTCPECGGKVSSSANKCVHCGCPYTVCLECGKVHIGELQICPNCGFRITSIKEVGNTDKMVTVTNSDIMEIWKSRRGTEKIAIKITNIIANISFLISLFFCIAAFAIIDFNDTSTLEGFLKIKDVTEKAHGLIIAACVICLIAGVLNDEFKEIYLHVICAEWIQKKQIDIVTYLKIYKSEGGMKELPMYWTYENFSSAAYLSAVSRAKSIKWLKFVFSSLLLVLVIITVGICLIQNADELLRCKLCEEEFNFKYLYLIAAVVFAVLGYIVSTVFKKVFNKRKEAWLNSL